MTIDWAVVAQIAGPVIGALVGAAAYRALESRAKVITYVGNVSSFTMRGPAGDVTFNTHSVVVRNAGRKPARNVCLGHYFLPDLKVVPSVEYEIAELPDGTHELRFPTMVPGEQVTVSYLYFPPVTWSQINSQVKSDDGMAKVISVLPVPVRPAWFNALVVTFLVIGVIATVYVLVAIMRATM
jgi:hypothetical protein